MLVGRGNLVRHDPEGGIGDGFQFFPLFGLPFIIIGLLMMSAPLWAYYASRKAV
jgi:hypothetical protein